MKLGCGRAQLLAPLAKFVQLLTFGLTVQPDRSWLKAVAPSNIWRMSITEPVLHAPMFWLNAAAFVNVANMLVTALVSHFVMSWLNPEAYANMPPMFVTAVMSQLDKSGLNEPGLDTFEDV